MVKEVRRQFANPAIRNGTQEPDFRRCIAVSTDASLREMIPPGLLVILTPLFFGIVFHPLLLCGLLPGTLVSGVQLATSMSNTGGAWDNTKKYIESGRFKDQNGVIQKKHSEQHKAAVIGDTVGDPLKDTSGPSLNILIKLMAIISLVFIEGFKRTSFLKNLVLSNDLSAINNIPGLGQALNEAHKLSNALTQGLNNAGSNLGDVLNNANNSMGSAFNNASNTMGNAFNKAGNIFDNKAI